MSASVIESERERRSSKRVEYSDNVPSKSSSASRDSLEVKINNVDKLQLHSKEKKDENIDLPSPKLQPTAFTIDFGDGKSVDRSKLESLAKKSQARHQRVQSMSASLQRPTATNNTAQRPTMSAKLPRKTHGYNSEGYFSSDQEDSVFSTSTKIKQSSLAQNVDKNKTHNSKDQPNFDIITFRKTTFKNSPVIDNYHAKPKHSKSPIVDSIMSRSDTLPSKHNLNLPLKSNFSTNYTNRNAYINPNYSNLSSSYHERINQLNIMTQVIDQSPDGQMITDISSPELDVLTPDNGLSSPEQARNKHNSKLKRNIQETTTLQADIFKKCFARNENDDNEIELDRQSNNSSTGTYTIEGDNYTEEQKARMSIDRVFAADNLHSNFDRSLRSPSREKDPGLIIDNCSNKVITQEPLPRNLNLRMPLSNDTFQLPNRVSTDKNVLEITCCYESPTEMTELAVQTSKQIKSTRNYLEKIKNRVKTISEKTFQKPSPPKQFPDQSWDIGSFTSVTTSGVLSSSNMPKPESVPQVFKRKNSLTKSQVDSSEYIHRLTRESSVPVTLPSDRRVTETVPFGSTVLRSAQRAVENEHNIKSNISPEKLVGKLSYLSLNRCKGDKTWIQEWADSVKKYNKEALSSKEGDGESEPDRTSGNESVSGTSILSGLGGSSRPPMSSSPRHMQGNKAIAVRCTISATTTPTKIPSPLAAAHARNLHQEGLAGDTETYLRNTQNAISNLQAKLQHGPTRSNVMQETSALTASSTSEKVPPSRLPVSQLSRSNSLNYRLRRRNSENSPLRSPENYVITGSASSAMPNSARLLLNATKSRSLEARNQSGFDSNMNSSPVSEKGPKSNSSDDKTLSNRPPPSFRQTHSRHKSFDGRSSTDYLNSPSESLSPSRVSLKTVLKNNAIAEAQYSQLSTPIIEQAIGCQGDYESINPRNQPHRTPTALSPTANIAFGNSIRRSSSFNTVNKNNNYIDTYSRNSKFNNSRRSSGNSENVNGILNDYSHKTSNIDVVDYNSDDSDNISSAGFYSDIDKRGLGKDVPAVANYSKPIAIHRARLESPDLKSRAPANSPRCPNTPEMQRKFGPGLVRNSNARCASKERPAANTPRTDREKSQSQTARKISDTTRQSIVNRLTKSKSSTKDFQHKSQNDKNVATKKAPQYGSTASLASKEREFSKWKKRSSYDPMKAAREGRRRVQPQHQPVQPKEELSSPSHASPVHRSQSFNCTSSLGATAVPDYSSCSDTDLEEVDVGLYPMQCDVVLTRDYVAHFQVPAQDKRKVRPSTGESRPVANEANDLTTESWSATSLDEATQDAVVRRDARKSTNVGTNGQKRYSGDYSMSSSATSVSREAPATRQVRAQIAPRYLESCAVRKPAAPRAFLRRDPAKLYLLPQSERPANHQAVGKASAKQVEMAQRSKELEKWKRRASYDPRKAAAQAKSKPAPKMTSSVLRSQSFHGPMHGAVTLRYVPPPTTGDMDLYQDGSSDNDF